MKTTKDKVAVSSLYTAAVWRWGKIDGAAYATPDDAMPLFKIVNAYMALYRFINPKKYSLKHQLLHRHTAINHLIERGGYRQVIEVACGFSPRGGHFSAQPNLDYIEMDLADVIAAKRRQLELSDAGRAVLARNNYQLRAADILTLDFETEVPSVAPVAVITEGLMMYFSRTQQMAIWQGIARMLAAHGGSYLFDYIPLSDEPARSPLGKLLHWIKSRLFGESKMFAYDQRTRQDVEDDLRASGFKDVRSISTADVARSWNLPEAEVPSHTLIYVCNATVTPA